MITLFRLAFRLAMLAVTATIGIMAVTLATVDLSSFVAEFARSLSAVSGRPVTVAGGASVQYLPRPAIVLENVTVGSGSAGVARTPRLVLEMDPADLAFGDLMVGRVVAEDPEVVFKVDRRGDGTSVPPLSRLFGLPGGESEVLVRGGRLTLVNGTDGGSVTVPLGDGGGLGFGPSGPAGGGPAGGPGGPGGTGGGAGGGGLPASLPCP
ncbi:MAG: hypothetical protein WD270_06280 [Acetobacterales bacterium]